MKCSGEWSYPEWRDCVKSSGSRNAPASTLSASDPARVENHGAPENGFQDKARTTGDKVERYATEGYISQGGKSGIKQNGQARERASPISCPGTRSERKWTLLTRLVPGLSQSWLALTVPTIFSGAQKGLDCRPDRPLQTSSMV